MLWSFCTVELPLYRKHKYWEDNERAILMFKQKLECQNQNLHINFVANRIFLGGCQVPMPLELLCIFQKESTDSILIVA